MTMITSPNGIGRRAWLGLTLGVLMLSALGVRGQLPTAERILFLGDSITYQGTYVTIIEAALIAQYPERHFVVLNLGLSSETVSGRSEEGHAGGRFPRPDLHERLDRILTQSKPELVIACYGMNDGIYHPFDAGRFASFQHGVRRLREKVIGSGADIIHLTPPVFDPQPIATKVLPARRDHYPAPFAGYNGVLDIYAKWLSDQSKEAGWVVWDLHGEMNRALAVARASDPTFTFARDGVHPNAAGHLVMAGPILRQWGLKTTTAGWPLHPRGEEIFKLVQQKQETLRDSWLSTVGHQRPGVAVGLPFPKAEAMAAVWDTQARALAARP